MRPDVAPLGALVLPTVLLARHCARTRTPIRNIGFSRFPVSDLSVAFLPRSVVLSRHDTNVLVSPRDCRRRRASP